MHVVVSLFTSVFEILYFVITKIIILFIPLSVIVSSHFSFRSLFLFLGCDSKSISSSSGGIRGGNPSDSIIMFRCSDSRTTAALHPCCYYCIIILWEWGEN